MVPLAMLEKLRLHWCDSGLYKRRDKPWMRPAGPVTSSSTRLARPSQTFRTTLVPSYSSHVVEPVNGFFRRFRCVFHTPISKSKSPRPSRLSVTELCCAITETETIPMTRSHNTKQVNKYLDGFINIFLKI